MIVTAKFRVQGKVVRQWLSQ